MPRPDFFDRLVSNGTLAMIGAVTLPVATGMFGNLAELVNYVGPQGLLHVPGFLLHNSGEMLGRMAADGLRMVPEFMGAAAIGTLAVSTVEKISGRQLTNFSLAELAKNLKHRLSGDPRERDAPVRCEPEFQSYGRDRVSERSTEYVRPHMQRQARASDDRTSLAKVGRDE